MTKKTLKNKLLIIALLQIFTATLLITTTYALNLTQKIDPLAKPLIKTGVAVGLIIGIVKDGETQVIAYGEKTKGSNIPPDADTVFEIGSASKVFTGIVLADMVQKGIVKLDDPVQKYLPDGVTMPILEGKTITLKHLATHTSGLPRMPDNFMPKDPSNPYADYSEAQMYEFLNRHKLRRVPGQYEYSNYGMGLLGYLLARKLGKSYEQCIIDVLCKPIGMTDTSICLNEDQQKRFATPYSSDLNPVSPWDFTTLAGCGGIRSTCNNMIKFIKANIKDDNEALTQTLRMSHKIHHNDGMAIGLAWHILQDGTRWHNGGTGGFHSWIGIFPEKNSGIVVLANTSNMQITQFGMQIMRIALGEDRKEIELSQNVLESYTGVYSLVPNFNINITVENGILTLQATGQGKIPFYPESETEFFCKLADIQISFVSGQDGKIDYLILTQSGIDQKAIRKGDVTERKAVEVSSDILKSYTGSYMIAPNVAMKISLENGKLMGNAPGMNSFQLFPESKTKFFMKEIPAKISFVPDEGGKVNYLILHHPGGNDQKAVREE